MSSYWNEYELSLQCLAIHGTILGFSAQCTQIELRGHFEHQLLDFADFGECERRVEVRMLEAELLVDFGAQLACLHPRDDAGHEACVRVFAGEGMYDCVWGVCNAEEV